MTDYYGIREPADNTNLTAEAGTNETTVVCSALLETDNDAYNGFYLHNVTRSTGGLITDYTGLTQTIIMVATTGQTVGDSFYIINPWRIETVSGTVRDKGLSITNRSKGLEVIK